MVVYTHYVRIPHFMMDRHGSHATCVLSWHGRMCVITEAKKLGVFADIMDKAQNPLAACYFLRS